MALRLNGSTSGYVELNAPAVAGSQSLTIPDSINAAWTDATQQNTNGANEYLFTGLPTDVRELVVNFDNVSWTTGSNLQFQLGTSSGLVGGSGYLHGYAYLSGGSVVSNGRVGSNAFVMGIWTSASHGINGTIRFTNIYDNNWSVEGILHTILDNSMNALSGFVDLGGTLDRIAIQNRAGNNFDAGAVNIHYITN